jgi:cold shock CspA family protein
MNDCRRIIVYVTALRRSEIGPGERVCVDVVDGRKGLEAERIILL